MIIITNVIGKPSKTDLAFLVDETQDDDDSTSQQDYMDLLLNITKTQQNGIFDKKFEHVSDDII